MDQRPNPKIRSETKENELAMFYVKRKQPTRRLSELMESREGAQRWSKYLHLQQKSVIASALGGRKYENTAKIR